MTKFRISEIDALRGIACLMVVLNHFGNYGQLSQLGFNMGCTGVDLFFIISGFVISLTIEGNPNRNYFLINRFSRLFPAYWTCVTLTALAILISNYCSNTSFSGGDFIKIYLENLTMCQFYFNAPNIDGSYWTMLIELLFYFFIFLFLFFNKKTYIESVGAAFLLLPLCLFLFSKEITPNNLLTRICNNIPLVIYFPLFYSGILFYKLKFDKKTVARWALLLISFSIQLLLFDKFYSNRPELSFTQYFVILIIFYGAFILYLFNKLVFIVNTYTVWLGSISYCLYLIHQVIGVQTIMPFLFEYLHINFTTAFILTLIILFTLSFLILKYIERPGILFIRKKYALHLSPRKTNSK